MMRTIRVSLVALLFASVATLHAVEPVAGWTDEKFGAALPAHNPKDRAMVEIFATLPKEKPLARMMRRTILREGREQFKIARPAPEVSEVVVGSARLSGCARQVGVSRIVRNDRGGSRRPARDWLRSSPFSRAGNSFPEAEP